MRHRLSRTLVDVLVAQQRLEDAEALASGCVEQGVATFGEFDADTTRAKAALRDATALRSRLDNSVQRQAGEAEHQHAVASTMSMNKGPAMSHTVSNLS